jgi:hypothetical protein
MAIILFSNSTPPISVSSSMVNSFLPRTYMTVYQAELPGWRRGWSDLAEASGGYAVKTKTDSFPEIEQILRDLDQGYLLGYIPDERTLDVESQMGSRNIIRISDHSVKLQTTAKDAIIRTRETFSSLMLRPGANPAPRAFNTTQRKTITSSPFIAGGLEITTEAIPYFNPKRESVIRVMLNVKGKDLRFLPEPGKGFSTARIAINGQLLSDGRVAQSYSGNASFPLPQQEFGIPADTVYSTSFDIPAEGPGLYVLRTSVLQGWEGLVGNTAILVEVPDFTKSGLVASGIATYPLSKDPEASSQPQPIMRKIHRTDPFGCSLSVYNAKRDASSGSAQIESQLRLYRGDTLVQASEVVPVPDQGKDSISKGIAVSFGVAPNPNLTAGNYLLEVLVIDKLAGNKSNTTAQTVAIELFE